MYMHESCHNRHTSQVTPPTAFVGVFSEVCVMNILCMYYVCMSHVTIDTPLKQHPQQLVS